MTASVIPHVQGAFSELPQTLQRKSNVGGTMYIHQEGMDILAHEWVSTKYKDDKQAIKLLRELFLSLTKGEKVSGTGSSLSLF